MRETRKISFIKIAEEMGITREKAKHTYDMFYHRQVVAYVKELERQAKAWDDKQAIWKHYFSGNKSAKKRYEIMMEEKGR